ncbi:recombinase family protein [Streptomyces sp. AV19]|uniref:recombinase family protein n=1 Tax=Streptomyces sp. AV19 TaxID=2793068 RepID=UPI0018FE3EDD|nr:recombinase family protein [Streptomyces sp. AV19]MBH1938002.1 recombinase family protein [Streptomyces sp. AV19]MDG4536617.1 recombinase family protein [Streptomyces sp. AV19]
MVATAQVKAGAAFGALTGGVYPETDQPRALSAIRLSVETDETTSPGRQREANERAAASIGARVIGQAVDLGVSASKTTPFERPELGEWLARPDDFDVILFWRLDRAVRSMADMSALVGWARKHGKRLVFAEGPGGSRLELDMSNVVGELIATLLAFAAQMEAQSIAERVLGAQAAMRVMPFRWRGSRPPYGYVPAELDGGGWTLVQDPEAVAVLERIIRDLLGGATVSAVAASLNAEGVPSPRDHWALRKGRTTGGRTGGAKGQKAVMRERFKWTPNAITKLLRSPALLGWKMHDGKPVRDSEGAPIMSTAEPVLTRAEYDTVGALLDSRALDNSRERKDTNALLLGVIHCVSCAGRMYLNKQASKANQAPTYKCNSHARGDLCEAPANVRGDWADEYVTREFLALVGALPVTHVIETPGYDPAPEIAATLTEYEEHQRQEGRQRSKAAREAWQRRADALDARLAVLEETPKVEPHREVISTGRTYADEWSEADTTQRRRMLTGAGAHLTVKRGTRGGWRRLDESRVMFSVQDDALTEAADYVNAALEDAGGFAMPAHGR